MPYSMYERGGIQRIDFLIPKLVLNFNFKDCINHNTAELIKCDVPNFYFYFFHNLIISVYRVYFLLQRIFLILVYKVGIQIRVWLAYPSRWEVKNYSVYVTFSCRLYRNKIIMLKKLHKLHHYHFVIQFTWM